MIRCEARQCPNDAVSYKVIDGQPYLLCMKCAQMPDLNLGPPLAFEGLQRAYNKAHPRANGGTT